MSVYLLFMLSSVLKIISMGRSQVESPLYLSELLSKETAAEMKFHS